MGTSNSATGPKGNQPNLLPPWAPEGPMPAVPPVSPPDGNEGEQPKNQQENQIPNDTLRPPSVSWNQPKSALTSFANRGGSGRLKKTARNYVKARGGSSTAAITGRSGRKTTARLANFIVSGIKKGFAEAAKKLGVQDITSRNVHSVLADFIDKIAPVGATIENTIARKALIATITEIFEDMEVEKKGIGVLDQIKEEDMQKIIVSSIANYINERFQQELINRLERSKIGADYANQLSMQIRDYIIGLIKLDIGQNNIKNFDWESPEGTKRIQGYYEKAYRLLGEEKMISNILVIDGDSDNFSKKIESADTKLLIPINTSNHVESIETSLPNLFKSYNLAPSSIAYDFLRLAIAVYSADVRISRNDSYDQWTRDFHLYLPVSDISKWDGLKTQIQAALSFLTGDHWELYFRSLDKSSKKYVPGKKTKSLNVSAVSLFSGGLDSYCGSIDSLVSKHSMALVGHHSAGGGATSKSQDKTLQNIRKKFNEDNAPFLKIWVSAPKGKEGASEITTRGRSILFIGLGVFIANGLNVKELIMPENGLISLNVPLSNSRLGSYSTRTTHPYFVKSVVDILKAVGLDIELNLIYRFKTKGEMLSNCLNKDLLLGGLKDTMSCSHPSAGRYAKIKGNPHCGYCLPCIIRRAAIWKVFTKDDTKYAYNINDKKLTTNKILDQKALLMALIRQKTNSPNLTDILTSGPLPVGDEEKQEYLNVYKRGMQEVKEFMSQYVSI